MPRKKEIIDRLVDPESRLEPRNDHSLQSKARHRAVAKCLPRTQTAWEWEDWYAQYGVPEEHHCDRIAKQRPGLRNRIRGWFRFS